MSRTVDQAVLDALAKPGATWVRLYDIAWSDGTLRRTDAGVEVTDTSRSPAVVYTPSTELVAVGQIVETAEPRANTLTLTFDAVTSAMVGAALSGPAAGWTVEIRGAALDADDAVIGSPVLLFSGRGASVSVRGASDGPTVELEVASHWAAWRVVSGRATGSESQAAHFASDKGFDFAGDAEAAGDLKWGGG